VAVVLAEAEEGDRNRFGGRVKKEPPGTNGPVVGAADDVGDVGVEDVTVAVAEVEDAVEDGEGVGGMRDSFGGTNRDPEIGLATFD